MWVIIYIESVYNKYIINNNHYYFCNKEDIKIILVTEKITNNIQDVISIIAIFNNFFHDKTYKFNDDS